MAIVVAQYPGRPPPLPLLYAFILGAAAGTALAHAHAHLHNAIGFETSLNRAKVLSYKVCGSRPSLRGDPCLAEYFFVDDVGCSQLC
jgi:hypothetical protein